MAVKSGARTLEQALSDLLAGMGQDDELLAIDDGSEDATPRILHRWLSLDARVRVITTTGVGLVSALNLGMQEATHGWVARADADDRYPRSRLALQRDALGQDVVLVTGDYRLIPSQGGSTYLPCALGHPFVALSLINPQRIPHPGVLLRRDAVIAVGGYREDDFPAEDLALWLRLSEQGKFVGVPEVVVDWTMSGGSVSHSRQTEQRSRTQALLGTWRPSVLGEVNREAVLEELARYESSSYAGQRAWLLLRDLRSWLRRGESLPGQREVKRYLASHPGSSLAAGWHLTREAVQRRRARSLLATPLGDVRDP